jgi:hypothetical protein
MYGDDPWTTINTQLITAIFRSVEGDHEGALRHLENLQPLVRLLAPHQPLISYIYINSLAVELSEVGRLGEAQRLSEIAVRSPYAHAYPEWLETYDEIRANRRRASPAIVGGISWPQESREVAAHPVAAHNVVAMPVAARPLVAVDANVAGAPLARVIAYHGWQQPTPEQADALQEIFTSGDLEQMSIADKQMALLNVIYSDNVTHHTLDQLLATAAKVTAKAPAS